MEFLDDTYVDETLLARYLADECTPEEVARVREWADAIPTRAAELAGMARAWERAEALPTAVRIDEMWGALAGQMTMGRARRRWRHLQPLAWAASIAAVGVGILLGHWVTRSPARLSRSVVAAPTADASSLAESRLPVNRAAVIEHLGRTEVLLTSLRISAHQGVDSETVATARRLLAVDRVLLDSQSGDMRIRDLLSDLELILLRLAQLSPNSQPESSALILDDMERVQLIPRLRLAVPAGSEPYIVVGTI